LPQGEWAETLRYLALLLGLAPDDDVPQVLLLFFAARRFIECVGLAQPTVFVFEDIHWARSSEIALLEYLAQHVRDSPVMLSAAVIGKTFWRGVLQAAGGVEDIDETLAVLEARDLVRRDPSTQLSADPQFTFKHMLIREVAYSIVPRAARRERHAAVARHV